MSYKEMDRTANLIASVIRNSACNAEEVISILVSFCDDFLPMIAQRGETYKDIRYSLIYYWHRIPEEQRHDYKKMYEYLFVEEYNNE